MLLVDPPMPDPNLLPPFIDGDLILGVLLSCTALFMLVGSITLLRLVSRGSKYDRARYTRVTSAEEIARRRRDEEAREERARAEADRILQERAAAAPRAASMGGFIEVALRRAARRKAEREARERAVRPYREMRGITAADTNARTARLANSSVHQSARDRDRVIGALVRLIERGGGSETIPVTGVVAQSSIDAALDPILAIGDSRGMRVEAQVVPHGVRISAVKDVAAG